MQKKVRTFWFALYPRFASVVRTISSHITSSPVRSSQITQPPATSLTTLILLVSVSFVQFHRFLWEFKLCSLSGKATQGKHPSGPVPFAVTPADFFMEIAPRQNGATLTPVIRYCKFSKMPSSSVSYCQPDPPRVLDRASQEYGLVPVFDKKCPSRGHPRSNINTLINLHM